MMVMGLCGLGSLSLGLGFLILDVLLKRGEVLLGGGKVAGLEILGKLGEGLGDGIAALRCGSRNVLGYEFLQAGENRLRGR